MSPLLLVDFVHTNGHSRESAPDYADQGGKNRDASQEIIRAVTENKRMLRDRK